MSERLNNLERLLCAITLILSESKLDEQDQLKFKVAQVNSAYTSVHSKLPKAEFLGGRWLREVEKTAAIDLVKALFLCFTMVSNGFLKKSPQWEETLVRSRDELDAILLDSPSVFNMYSNSRRTGEHWQEIKPNLFYKSQGKKPALSLALWQESSNKSAFWIIQIGGIGIGLHSDFEQATSTAETAANFLFPEKI